MSEHTPQHHTRNPHPSVHASADDGVDPTQAIDAGGPQAPITVRRTTPAPADAQSRIGGQLAARRLSVDGRPGIALVDPTDGHAFTVVHMAGAAHE